MHGDTRQRRPSGSRVSQPVRDQRDVLGATMRLRIIAGSIGAIAVAAVSIALGALISGHTTHPPTPKLIIAQSDQLLPSESLADWSSFADHLAVVTVTSERRLQPTAEEIAANEGYIPRVITL